jgi:hypothetical protein
MAEKDRIVPVFIREYQPDPHNPRSITESAAHRDRIQNRHKRKMTGLATLENRAISATLSIASQF